MAISRQVTAFSYTRTIYICKVQTVNFDYSKPTLYYIPRLSNKRFFSSLVNFFFQKIGKFARLQTTVIEMYRLLITHQYKSTQWSFTLISFSGLKVKAIKFSLLGKIYFSKSGQINKIGFVLFPFFCLVRPVFSANKRIATKNYKEWIQWWNKLFLYFFS